VQLLQIGKHVKDGEFLKDDMCGDGTCESDVCGLLLLVLSSFLISAKWLVLFSHDTDFISRCNQGKRQKKNNPKTKRAKSKQTVRHIRRERGTECWSYVAMY
jgi:hypothetical protein